MFTYIFVDCNGTEIARRETDVEIGIKDFIRFENENFRISPTASNGKILICFPVHSKMIKYNPTAELVNFFKAVGIDQISPTNCGEESIKDAFLSLLSPIFNIEQEVTGDFMKPDKNIARLRIDAILTPKENEHTKLFNNYRPLPFGIEFKSPQTINKGSDRSQTKILSQCTDYAHCDFRGYGRVPVFAFPFFNHRAHVELLNYTANSNVGVITTHAGVSPYYAFRLGEMALWDSTQGFTQLGQQRKLERKYGNRT